MLRRHSLAGISVAATLGAGGAFVACSASTTDLGGGTGGGSGVFGPNDGGPEGGSTELADGRVIVSSGGNGQGAGANGDASIGTGGDSSIIGTGGSGGESKDCKAPCPDGTLCNNGVCVTKADCEKNSECQNDSYCKKDTGCVPYGSPPDNLDHDEKCQTSIPPGNFAPRVKCEFKAAPAGDPFPNHNTVQSTPTVVNFGDPAAGSIPSIVVAMSALDSSFGYNEGAGIIRVLRGDDCTVEANLGGGQAGYTGYVNSPSSVALGDLDGDGFAEIVAIGADGKLVAFTRKAGTWSVLWTGAGPVPVTPYSGTRWSGPSMHDLDDDGIPEIIVEGMVSDGATGGVKATQPPDYVSHSIGLDPVLANLDSDANIELTNGAHIWEYSAGAWKTETYFSTSGPGFPAIADFGPYGGAPSIATSPEIAVVRAGSVAIYALDGSVVLPVTNNPGPGGGPPTIADYDGDGLPELGVAGQAFLTVFDIDCVSPRVGGECKTTNACDDAAGVGGPCPAGILWSRKTQDLSSNITGSSVFDFEADGKAEVVYADECFARVYAGPDGTVLFSQYHSSCTWYENPIVADTDGNFRADLVVPGNLACGAGGGGIACTGSMDANGVDAQFAGLRCKEATDCTSGNCADGFCRCTASADCCDAKDDAACVEEGVQCAPPPAGTPGTGNTCRAGHPHGVTGIRVYSDRNDAWVGSRTIWNQHAYAVTHVNENGTVPKTSAWKNNWEDKTLNNFRQNVPGDASGEGVPDLTAGPSGFKCAGQTAKLSAPLCNRGAAPVGPGIAAGFYDGDKVVCQAKTTKPLDPGQCETVSCDWDDAPPSAGAAKSLEIIADDTKERKECYEDNNGGEIPDVFCKPLG